MTLLGNLALWLTLLLAVWGAAAGALGASHGRRDLARSAERAGRVAAAALGVALGALVVAVFRNDFNVAYVAAHAGRTLPAAYRWTVLYAGPEGVALLYATALAASAALGPAERHPREQAWRTALAAVVLASVAAALVFVLNPFRRIPFTPVDGAGLDPLLQQAAGAAALPLSLAAYAVLTVPFAGAITGLAARRLDGAWVRQAHRWMGGAWTLLTAGTLLGARAAYLEPLPPDWWTARPDLLGGLAVWTAITLALHGTAVETRRPGPARWSPALVTASWVVAAAALGIAAARWAAPLAIGLGVTAAVLAGAIVLWHARRRVEVAGPDSAAAPPAPGTSRVVAHLVHAGAALVAIAGAAAAGRRVVRVELDPATSSGVTSPGGVRYELTYLGTSRYERGNQIVTAATIEMSRAGRRLGVRRAERLLYVDMMGRQVAGAVTRAAVWSAALADIRVELLETGQTGETVVLRLALTPLVAWVWVGGGLVVLGGLLGVWRSFAPSSERRE